MTLFDARAINIQAASGRAIDIQEAVNQVVSQGGLGNVHIPPGTHHWVEVGQPWMTVNIPAGVNVYGAPTQRTSGIPYNGVGMNPNDQVVQHLTELLMVNDLGTTLAQHTKHWFDIKGLNDPTKPTRISDLKMVGHRSIDPLSHSMSLGFSFTAVTNFRLDHIETEHVTGGVGVHGLAEWANPGVEPACNGVVDHVKMTNPIGYVVWDWNACTVGYGVSPHRYSQGDWWDPNIENVLGKYTPYTTFIEDSFFSGFRHVTASNSGAHYVFRHNTIDGDYGAYPLDSHGWGVWDPDTQKVIQVGARATELYNNKVVDATISQSGQIFGLGTATRGGAGVAFNNRFGGGQYYGFIFFSNEAAPEVSKCWINDWYVWNNTLLVSGPDAYRPNQVARLIQKYDSEGTKPIVEDVNYFLYKPTWYTPYPYPHPLTRAPTIESPLPAIVSAIAGALAVTWGLSKG